MSRTPTDDVTVAPPRNYLRPCLLLLLAEGTSHGYELLDQLPALGMDRVDPGGLYRCLRAMDEDGLVHSTWAPSTTGPARRTYSLTLAGRDRLDAAARALVGVQLALSTYQQRHARLAASIQPLP